MKICIIGKSRHAKLHQKYIEEASNYDEFVYYHPSHAGEPNVVNNIEAIIESDLVIIASPTRYHIHYLRLLQTNNYKGYVYVEKPGFDNSIDGKEMLQIGSYFSRRIKIGYHMRDCNAVRALKEMFKRANNGDFTIARLVITKNISGGSDFKKSWRSNDKLAISHTLASHLLSIIVEVFGIETLKVIELGLAKSNEVNDTCIISGLSKDLYVSGVASWGLTRTSPYIEIIGRSSKIVFKDYKLQEIREELNETSDPISFIDESMSIKQSIQHFTAQARSRKDISDRTFKENVEITLKCLENIKSSPPLL